MITHCLECDTYFRVSIEQLKTANGQVKCGCCMTIFNAIESLLESPDVPSHSTISGVTGQAVPETGEATGSALLGTDEPDFNEELIILEEEPDDTSLDDIDFDSKEETEAFDDAEFTLTDSDTFMEEKADSMFEETLAPSDENPEFSEDQIHDTFQQPHKRSNTVWLVSSLVLMVLMVFQLIKFNSETIISTFAHFQISCRFIECPVEKELNDTSIINLVSRDVREHPQFKNVLLVNATLMNNANDYQPFPRLQLDLFDKAGKPVGSRLFAPDEYLDSSVDLGAGMKPELPVHIVLEVIGNGEETSSFEFKFL